MNFKKRSIKKIQLIVAVICLPAAMLFGDSTLKIHKEEILEIMNNFCMENEAREKRIRPAAQVKINPPVHGKPASTNHKKPAPQKPRQLEFTSKTVWGEYTVNVTEYPGRSKFLVSFSNFKYPVQYLELFDKDKHKLLKEHLNDATMYSKQVNFEFKPMYKLLLKLNINDEIQPVIIPLYHETKIKHK